MGAGTEGRRWLDGAVDPPVVGAMPPATAKAVELTEANAKLVRDSVTGVWGVPVSRRGDPDYAKGNPNHTGAVRTDPLVLPARVVTPDGVLDPAKPCILITNGYGVGKVGGAHVVSDPLPFAERGYTSVVVSLRQGSMDPLDRQIGVTGFGRYYGEDGVEIINWVVQKFGCGMTGGNPATAKVGMIGASLLGYSQWAMLKQSDLPPALKAIAPDVAGTTFYGLWYPGGMLPGPGRMRRGAEFPFLFPDHRDFDDYWASFQLTPAELVRGASRGVAALVTGGWPDYITPGAIETYTAYRALSGDTPKKLFIGPTGHTTPARIYTPVALQWMDYWLKGEKNGIERDRVTLFVQGPNRWRAEDAWPIPDARNVKLYLRAQSPDGRNAANTGSLRPAAPAKDAAFGFSYDPETGPFLKTMLSSGATTGSPRLSIDQSADEKKTANWTSDALATATEVTGVPRLTFWASSSTTDADFVVHLTDVAPDGTSRAVTPGYLNGPRQHYNGVAASTEPPNPLKPNEPRQFTVDLYPTSYVFPAGHRIRIAIAGGADVAMIDGKPQPGAQGPGKNPSPFSVRILQDAAHPSSIELPVIGTGLAASAKRGD